MNFFRLRVLNTFLLFLIGIVAGFILKERFYPSPARQAYAPDYRSSYARTAPAPVPAAEEEPYAAEAPEEEPQPKEERAAPAPRVSARTLDEASEKPLVIEPEPPARERKAEALKNAEEEFFKRPDTFAGKDLEMDLQMITAKKSRGGWRLNLVYTSPDKQIDYLYAEDGGTLGEKPDLRIGYVYKVRFHCGKGETAAGNTISSITPTGGKADWATGLSAVEQ